VLIELCRKAYTEVLTIRFGVMNDAAFLNGVDVLVLMRSKSLYQLMARVPLGIATEFPRPKVWNEAIVGVLERSDCQGESHA
jgi:hypothetical protein